MDLQQQYKEENNREPTENVEGFTCYTDDYVEWLESKLSDLIFSAKKN